MNVAILDRSRMRPDRLTTSALIVALAAAMDLVNPTLAYHHKRVGLIGRNIACACGLSREDTDRAVAAGLLHDIGYLSHHEIPWTADEHPTSLSARIGGRVLACARITRALSAPVATHWMTWAELRRMPGLSRTDAMLSQILSLADAVDRMLDRSVAIHSQVAAVRAAVAAMPDARIDPGIRAAFDGASEADAFWLDVVAIDLDRRLDYHFERSAEAPLDSQDLADFGRLYSIVVDARSAFTATHSWGVAAVAGALGGLVGLSSQNLIALELAGQLHDVGKMAVDPAVLQKPGKLTPDEFAAVRAHAYYTGVLLARIPGFGELARWAADHHEQPNGLGYPARLPAAKIALEARLLAVADRFVALTEDRPYRDGFAPAKALSIIEDAATAGEVDTACVRPLRAHIDAIDGVRREAQAEERAFVRQLLSAA